MFSCGRGYRSDIVFSCVKLLTILCFFYLQMSLISLQLFDTLLHKDDEHIVHNLVLRNLEKREYHNPKSKRKSGEEHVKDNEKDLQDSGNSDNNSGHPVDDKEKSSNENDTVQDGETNDDVTEHSDKIIESKERGEELVKSSNTENADLTENLDTLSEEKGKGKELEKVLESDSKRENDGNQSGVMASETKIVKDEGIHGQQELRSKDNLVRKKEGKDSKNIFLSETGNCILGKPIYCRI